jgi:hypothetical protein
MENDPLAMLAPPDPTWNPGNTVPPDAMVAAPAALAAAPAAAEPMATIDPSYPTSIPSETAPNNPDIERSYHESTWRRILDKVGGILGGDTTIHVTKDKDGNVTMTHDPSTTGEKWSRIAAAALGGAAQGAANSRGPGGAFRGAAAGTEFGLQQGRQQQEDADKQATAEQKRQQMNANGALIHQQLYTSTLQARALNTKLTEDQASMLNEYKDSLAASPNSKDYGTIASEADLMKVATENQAFLQQHTNLQLKAVPVPDGKGGIALHAIATDPGDDMQPSQKGDYLFNLDADPKTGKPILSKEPVSAGSRKSGELRLANQKKLAEFFDAQNKYQKSLNDTEKADREKVPTTYEAAVIQKYKDKYPKDPARALDEATTEIKEAEKKRFAAPTININQGGITQPGTQISELIQPGARFADGTVDGTIAYKLAHHDMTLDEIPKRYGKGVPTPQEYTSAAEAISQRDYGLPYSPTMIKQEEKVFDNMKTTGVLNGIDKLVGVGGSPGYLDTVVSLAERAGVGSFAPIQEIKRAVKTKLGDSAMKDFNAALAEVQRSLPTLIGNPTIGGSDSDLKQKAAEKAFGQNITLENLKSNAEVFKGMLMGSRDSLTRNNRFLQDRYGLKGSGAHAPTPSPTPGPTPGPGLDQSNPPPIEKVPAGNDTTFANGQVWRNVNGKAQRIK